MIRELADRIRFWREADRLGPDVPWTHWRLHFKSTMLKLAHAKFRHFGEGAEFRAGAYAVVCSKISLGRRVVIRPGCMLFADPHSDGAGITIKDGAMLGSGVHIYVSNHRFDDRTKPIIDQGHYESLPVTIEEGAWIGACTVLLPGVTIGRNAVIGASSVVTRDIPAFALAVGNPARVIRIIGEEPK